MKYISLKERNARLRLHEIKNRLKVLNSKPELSVAEKEEICNINIEYENLIDFLEHNVK